MTSCCGGEPEEEPLIDLESSTKKPSTSKVTFTGVVPLDQGNAKLVPYGSTALNQATTTCGLVILHTDDAQAVGYHWPYCEENEAYKLAFDKAIGDRQGTSIEVVVRGGKYGPQDRAPGQFGRYLLRTYGLPVTVYRQVVDGSTGSREPDPWVVVKSGGVIPPAEDYHLVAVQL